ncbi:hypothetical protein ScPMuIL_012029 [Solemya velum]
MYHRNELRNRTQHAFEGETHRGGNSSSDLGCLKAKVSSPSCSCAESEKEDKMASQQFLGPQFPAANSPQRIQSSNTLKPRNKVVLKPGHSLMDWIRLGHSGQDLTGVNGKIMDISQEELEKHNKPNDAWTSLRGRVYNITQYMDFHPGGSEELNKGAGKDCTQLFDEIHKWVNAESMLQKCYIGKLKVTTPVHRRVSAQSLSQLQPPLGPATTLIPAPPRNDWHQTTSTVIISIYTKDKSMNKDLVIINKSGKSLLATLLIGEFMYSLHVELEENVKPDYKVDVSKDTGKVSLTLTKETENHWKCLGKQLAKHNVYVKTKIQDIQYLTCTVDSVRRVTHDTKLLCVRLTAGSRMCVPLGYHVHLQQTVLNMEVSRSYTVVLPSLDPEEQDEEVAAGKVIYLMVKIYANGTLTPWIDTLSEGDAMKVSRYAGDFDESRLNECSHLVMYAAGTGFTPMIRLIYDSIIEDKESHRQVKLMFFNKKEIDIIWKDQLDSLAKQSKRFTVQYVLSDADEQWVGLQGRISKDLFQKFTPSQEEGTSTLVCACGPTQFTEAVLRFAEELGYTNVHGFQG